MRPGLCERAAKAWNVSNLIRSLVAEAWAMIVVGVVALISQTDIMCGLEWSPHSAE